ncbi:MAG TPA: LysM peptidoglycan-binding domain-containing protein [Saprospiraceae bacterium]|nr:LysM peptidoglycan-binding domain-containing protein [Saprospiraceae bacterium]
MGLFDFLKKNKKVNTPTPPKPDVSAKADEMIRQQKLMVIDNTIAALGLDIENLNIDFYNNSVTVSGLVQSDADRVAVVEALNTVDGVYSVDDRLEVAAPKVEIYVIQKGDSLSKIAKHYYGDPMKYKELFELNKDVLKDPNTIFPGQEIKIPKEL